MRFERLWARLYHVVLGLCLVTLMGVSAAVPARAQTHTWDTMHPDSFDASIQTAREQCLRAVLTTAECDEFAAKLLAGEYEVVMVPDGIHYDTMNYSRDGEPYLQGETVKQIGGNTPARRVHLSSGRVLDWYAGFEGACNNVGINPHEPPAPTPQPEPECRWVTFSGPTGGGTHQHLDGFYYPNGYCGEPSHVGSYTFHMENTLQSEGGYWQCQ